MPAAINGLFEEDRFYVDTCQVNMSKDLLHTHACHACTCRAWLSLHPLFSAYRLLGTYLFTTYTYKCIHSLTRVYSIHFWLIEWPTMLGIRKRHHHHEENVYSHVVSQYSHMMLENTHVMITEVLHLS